MMKKVLSKIKEVKDKVLGATSKSCACLDCVGYDNAMRKYPDLNQKVQIFELHFKNKTLYSKALPQLTFYEPQQGLDFFFCPYMDKGNTSNKWFIKVGFMGVTKKEVLKLMRLWKKHLRFTEIKWNDFPPIENGEFDLDFPKFLAGRVHRSVIAFWKEYNDYFMHLSKRRKRNVYGMPCNAKEQPYLTDDEWMGMLHHLMVMQGKREYVEEVNLMNKISNQMQLNLNLMNHRLWEYSVVRFPKKSKKVKNDGRKKSK